MDAPPSTSVAQETPRNLFGFKDGTNNIKSEDGDAKLNEHLWVQKGDDSGADWMAGGTYFVVRKIHMFAEMWDNLRLIEQEQTFGRDKRYGAPLNVTAPTSGKDEFKPIDFKAKNKEGELEVPADSHIAIVNPEQKQGALDAASRLQLHRRFRRTRAFECRSVLHCLRA